MKNILVIFVVCVGVLCWVGCSDDKSTGPVESVETYNLSGNVRTIFASFGDHRANNLTMRFVDSKNDSHTVVTDREGHYSVDGLAAGYVSVSMFSTDTILTDIVNQRSLLHYLPGHATLTLSRDTVIDFQVRRMEIAFADGGSNPQAWAWEYGVKNEEDKYIFWYDLRGSDMRMRNNVQIPYGAFHLGFVILGQAAPSFSSYMDVGCYMNDDLMTEPGLQFSGPFTATERYWIEEIGGIDPYWPNFGILDFRLFMEFRKQSADYIYIKGIYIYYY